MHSPEEHRDGQEGEGGRQGDILRQGALAVRVVGVGEEVRVQLPATRPGGGRGIARAGMVRDAGKLQENKVKRADLTTLGDYLPHSLAPRSR